MSGRFDYVRYDETAKSDQEYFKEKVENLETMVVEMLDSPRKALALTKLEEFYMWVGKAIRDDQIKRGSDVTHSSERTAE